MPAPRLSQSAEAARAAAQQAEFNEKKWVWVPDAKEGYLAGWVNREEEEVAEVVMAASAEIRRVPFDALFKMNPPKFDRVEDIADLTFLNEASVVHNLRLRYGSGAIYTYSGLFLVAINPYQSLPLYSDGIIQQYRNTRREENPPHIFAVAERAWINMGEERENQSILITGESGAGKTESTKKVIQYLAAIAADAHLPTTPSHSRPATLGGANAHTIPVQSTGSNGIAVRRSHTLAHSMPANNTQTNSRSRLGLLERQILQANPILEAFGNAQTQRNNNSSRFGKFVRISFAPDGSIAGAYIDWYLLEKSRVVFRNEAERNFHVFYQLLAGADKTLRDKLLLDQEVEDYEYLNKSRREVDGVDDRDEWGALLSALDTVGFAPNEQFDLFRIAAAVLHIGNIAIVSTRADDAIMPDPSRAERVCHLLGIPVTDFTRAVLSPRVLAGREMVTQARTKQQALDELAALCKTLYEKSFGSLVEHINRALDRPSSKSTFIGVLDIAGFEIFETNSYEQLLINYTNEKLQQFFNHHMFVLEQEEYAREGINWDYVNFGLDLQPTIELIETSGNAIGILSCLDEECIMPKATDITFTNKLHTMWAGHTTEGEPHSGRCKYEPSRFEMGFIIQHYAGRVEYRTNGWLEKNKDPLNDNLSRVLAASSERYIAGLFAEYGDRPPARASVLGKKRILKKGAFRTVGQRHKEQLSSLMSQLQATQPHFVRCIVPNMHKKPGRIDVPLVLDQLRCNGVLEGIRIARLGYPNRLPFVEFRQRYEIITPDIIPRGYMDGREACRRMVHALELDETVFKIGTSKIFFKAGVLAELEERRDLLLFNVFSRVQATARKYAARRQMKKILNRAIAVRTIQRNARVYGELREWPWWQLYTKVRPLLAATRSDEELRKKEAELALIRERAERDKQEKDALENLNMSLEAEKRTIEDELEAERALGLDKDALLDRCKKREVELEEEIAALQADLDVLDSQLDRAMKLQKEGEDKHEILRRAFDEAAEHLVRLETEKNESASRENELTEQLGVANEEIDALRGDVEELRKVGEELKNLVQQREEDLVRSKERSELMAKELEGKLDVEARNKELFKDKLDSLETEARRAKEQLTEMARTANDYSSMIKKKEAQIAEHVKEFDNLKSQRSKLQEELDDLEKIKRASESELQALRVRQHGYDDQLGEATRQKVVLERQLAMAQAKYHDFEDIVLQFQRDKESQHRQLESVKGQLEGESTKRSQLEKSLLTQKTELTKLKNLNVKLERDLNKALKDVKDKEWELKQAESKRDRAIVEHKHVYEAAKKMTDAQLAEAQLELQKNAAYIRSLEKAKARLLSEAEDLARETERERAELRTKQKNAEVNKLAQEAEGSESSGKLQKRYETRINQLEQQQKTKEREYQERIEAAEMARAKAAQGEAFVRRTLTELETTQADTLSERKALQERLKSSEHKIKELQGHRENELRQQLAEQWEDERTQHQKDMAERDFTTDQTRKKYQAELTQLSEELQSQRDNISRLREDNRKLRSDYDELQLRYDDETYNSGGWKKEKERMEMKITDLTKAYEASTAAQTEQQSQIVALHSQVRELRGVLDEAEADRALLQKARRALQAELESIKLDHVDSNKLSTDQEFQRLQLKKQDLERSLEEQEDRVASAYERMKKAEAYASECQVELSNVRVENSELEKLNANLEKQIKELNVRIVDLETKSYANTPRSTISARRVENKIEELTHSLTEVSQRRSSKSPEKLLETERQRIKLEERKAFEAQIQTLRQTVDKMQTDETSLQAAKRRAEREALDYKQKALNLERELERMHTRLERPATVSNSPRK